MRDGVHLRQPLLCPALRDSGIPPEQAEAHAEAARTFIMNELVTKTDFHAGLDGLRRDLDAKIRDVESKVRDVESKIENSVLRITIRMGVMLAAAITLLGALQRLH